MAKQAESEELFPPGPSASQVAVQKFGRGHRVISTKRQKLTPDLAREFLGHRTFKGERPLRESHVQALVGAMQRGTFLWERADVSICKVGSVVYRVNGQHTCTARLQMPDDYECDVNVIIYEAETEKDLRKLYASIDRGAARTKAHVIGSYLIGSSKLGDLEDGTLKVLSAGYALWRFPTKHDRAQVDGDQIAVGMLQGKDADLVLKVGEFLDGLSHQDDKHLFRAPVVAAMLATFEVVEGKSKEFWKRIADGDGFSGRKDPRRQLRDTLMSTSVGAGGRRGSRRRGVTSEALFRGCIHGWNAWREGRTLDLLRLHDVGERPNVN